ncbi:hypothetical protein CORC01_10460 [Colletotrichum orchidophilum]|uniref:Uncharacterized protein n=1 Tax=Colletotrichum orchidophilum TaxID=1209926 RepID=A0A1G4AYN9_9PEZI|nr:uncharacterized protein CORC01_10460 [Colletotrichum orchidophilum]OHE94215.1 hypothetical protein CORC01_10460 [Colletotrichum orchidophilum]
MSARPTEALRIHSPAYTPIRPGRDWSVIFEPRPPLDLEASQHLKYTETGITTSRPRQVSCLSIVDCSRLEKQAYELAFLPGSRDPCGWFTVVVRGVAGLLRGRRPFDNSLRNRSKSRLSWYSVCRLDVLATSGSGCTQWLASPCAVERVRLICEATLQASLMIMSLNDIRLHVQVMGVASQHLPLVLDACVIRTAQKEVIGQPKVTYQIITTRLQN